MPRMSDALLFPSFPLPTTPSMRRSPSLPTISTGSTTLGSFGTPRNALHSPRIPPSPAPSNLLRDGILLDTFDSGLDVPDIGIRRKRRKSPPCQGSYTTDEHDATYLELEFARARRAVLQARVHLATCELSEQMLRTRLKIRSFKHELEDVDSTVGQWCDVIRRSGRPLYSRQQPRRLRTPCPRQSTGDEEFYVDLG